MFVSHDFFLPQPRKWHKATEALQQLSAWTCGLWVVSRCWYVGIGAWIFFQTNALFRTGGGLILQGLKMDFSGSAGGPGKVDVATLTNKPSKWVHALTISRSDRGPSVSHFFIWAQSQQICWVRSWYPSNGPLSILLDRKNDAGLEIRSMTPGKTTQSCKGKGDDLGDIAFSTEPWLWKKMRSRLGNVLLLHYHLKVSKWWAKWLDFFYGFWTNALRYLVGDVSNMFHQIFTKFSPCFV